MDQWDRRGRMVVWFTTTYAISAYHHISCEFESRLWRDILDTILCDKVVSALLYVGGFLGYSDFLHQ